MGRTGVTGRGRRRVAVVTGTRAEYGLLQSVMRAVARHKRLELQLVVTGMHLLPEFGRTLDTIVRDGWPIAARVPMQAGRDDALDQARGLARGVAGIAEFLERGRTDIVLVLGDRIEAMAGALAAVTTGRVVAHLHGGDVAPGDFDESLRHAITKLAHLHLVATRAARRRVVRMGEDPRRVFLVGAPGLDRMRELLRRQPARRAPTGAALVVQHACGRPAPVEQRVMTDLLEAVAAAGLRRIVLYPNTDRGHSGVLRAIARHQRRSPADMVAVVPSLPRDDYLRLLWQVDVLVGNSSSGIIEAPFAGTPAVNIGSRQSGRDPGGRTVIHTSESPAAIRAGLARALRLARGPRRAGQATPYGDGRAGRRVARVLAAVALTDKLLKKRLSR